MEQECRLLTFTTPKGVVLQGLWFGIERPKRIFIMLHGLGSFMFSNHDYLFPLVDRTTSVIFFNNRGHDVIARLKKPDRRKKKDTARFLVEQHMKYLLTAWMILVGLLIM